VAASTSSSNAEVRLAELVATLSLAADIGTGRPYENAQRAAIGAVLLGEELGLDESARKDTYYLTLLRFIGCVGDDDVGARLLGEDVGKWASHLANGPPLAFLWAVVQNTGKELAFPKRVGRVAGALAGLPNMMKGLTIHCEVGRALAERIGLGKRVSQGLTQVYERWDGGGAPKHLKGEAIDLPVRLAQVAFDVEVGRVLLGTEATIAMIRERSGTGYDPKVVEAFGRAAPRIFEATSTTAIWEATLAAEPGKPTRIAGEQVDVAIRAMGQYADLKSRFTHGHSAGVSHLAEAAARNLRLPASDLRAVAWAGHLHDLGRMGVLASVWDKDGALTDGEWERVRLHAYHTDRILSRAPSLAAAAAIASADHERLDGSGYHRRLPALAFPPAARVLAASDVYHAMTERRAHRPSMSSERAADELRGEARRGRLDGDAVEAVLSAAGHKPRAQPQRPGGLSDREIEVLRLVARGLTNKEVATALDISVKTIGHHLENIYGKIGVTTRAAATLFAMQRDLLPE
jgi:HD-GYP domain-containing protein (c-di-GMP phosphodiesterase class II)